MPKWYVKGEGPVSGNIQLLGIVVGVVIVVIVLALLLGGGERGIALFFGSLHNTVSPNVEGTAGGFTNPFTQGGLLATLFAQLFP